MRLKSIIESILFVSGRPVSLDELQKATGKPALEIHAAILELIKDREGGGIIVLENRNKYLLSTNPENSRYVQDFLNSELREKLTEASLETLAIVTYKQPVTRAEIESIRGVNSQYTLRLLMMRGLIEKQTSAKNGRVNIYTTTHEFLQHLGLTKIEDLPDFEELVKKVKPPSDIQNNNPPTPNDVTDPPSNPS